ESGQTETRRDDPVTMTREPVPDAHQQNADLDRPEGLDELRDQVRADPRRQLTASDPRGAAVDADPDASVLDPADRRRERQHRDRDRPGDEECDDTTRHRT